MSADSETVDSHLENRHVLRSAGVVSAGTGFSRILGFVREMLMAYFFGTSLAKSAFDVAFLIPNLFRRLFGEGAMSAAFVPVFAESIEKDGAERANCFAGRIITMLGTVLAGFVICGILIAVVVEQFAAGERVLAVMSLLRVMLPYMFFICLTALCMAILNCFRHFILPAITPAVLNVVWIVTLLFVCPMFGDELNERIRGVAWGILFAGALQFLIQIPLLKKFGFSPSISFAWRDERVQKVLLSMGPVALGVGLLQFNVFVDRVLALVVADWAPAALTYAERLIYLPLGLSATALSTVLLPTFSRQVAQGRNDEVMGTLNVAMRSMLLVVTPAAVGLLMLVGPIVRLVYMWPGGEFGADSLVYTTRALAFYAPGLVVFSLYKVLVPVFYALKDVRTPVKVGSRVLFLNFALNILFIFTWPAGYRHAGIAFATVISGMVSCFILGRHLHSRLGSFGWRAMGLYTLKVILISLVMGTLAVLSCRGIVRIAQGYEMTGKMMEFVAVGVSIVVGMAVYMGLAYTFCRVESRVLLGSVRR
ncbi:MAG: murein biosynthesis integral membrane protein MurJ [Kiritimatiellae bacterium]|nr:murein biosynthesis integral membrane protein MurJ [Kiritimatiellia bacterium]